MTRHLPLALFADPSSGETTASCAGGRGDLERRPPDRAALAGQGAGTTRAPTDALPDASYPGRGVQAESGRASGRRRHSS